MLLDQAAALRTLVMQSTEKSARTVAIASGKGGVGKSNVAVNLAACLATRGKRVVVLDADLGTANADILCNVRYTHTLAHVVTGRKSLVDVCVEAPGGFKLVPGASGLAQIASLGAYERERLIDQLGELQHDNDLLLVDTGAGVGQDVLSFLAGSDERIVVTTPEPTAIADAYAVIKALTRGGHAYQAHQSHQSHQGNGGNGHASASSPPEVSLLVNMVRREEEAWAVYDRIKQVTQHFLRSTPSFMGHLAEDAAVNQAVRERRPFFLARPNCPASVCIRQLADRLLPADQPPEAIESNGGLLRRMSTWLSG